MWPEESCGCGAQCLPESRAGNKTWLRLDICQISRCRQCYRGGIGKSWSAGVEASSSAGRVGAVPIARAKSMAGNVKGDQRGLARRLRQAPPSCRHQGQLLAHDSTDSTSHPLPLPHHIPPRSPAPASPCSPARQPAGAPSELPASRPSARPSAEASLLRPQDPSSISRARPTASSSPAETLPARPRLSRSYRRRGRGTSRCPA